MNPKRGFNHNEDHVSPFPDDDLGGVDAGDGLRRPLPGNVSREFCEPRERPSGRCRARSSASRRETSDGENGFS